MTKLKFRMVMAGLTALTFFPLLAHAQELAEALPEADAIPDRVLGMTKETAYILNSFMFLISGALVMWMAAGFSMLEAGLVRAQNTATICLKNVALYAIAGIMFYLVGYNIMYVDLADHGLWGSFTLFYDPSLAESALMASEEADEAALAAKVVEGADYASMSDWFFQMVFVATAASIVSGTVAERIKLWPFLIFVTILTAVIYPIQGSWSWGGGWLNKMGLNGFSDFAGSTLVHSVGGWAALTGAIILGPRSGKYGEDGRIYPIPGANMPLATLGTFILWMGWFGFNGGSVLALGSAKAVTSMSLVFVNTNMAAVSGCISAMLYATLRFGKPDLTMVLNGALAGLVAITAGPDVSSPAIAMLIGAIGGVLCCAAIPFFDKLKIDDVVGALSVHLVAGIWGTLAVAIFSTGDYVAQLTGIAATGMFVGLSSAVVWLVLKYTIGIRVDEQEERYGLDRIEVGLEAYPDFEIRRAG
ncbi:MAG: ammonium transporter [Rhodospirillales bacterium]|nr:ammonium transporter [Rhodospirillales bacterium]